MERVWCIQETFKNDSRQYMSCRNTERGRGCYELSQYRKLDPKLNTDIVIMICPKNRKVLVTLMKSIV